MQTKVIYLTHTTPSEIGNGGVHRSYQVLQELQQAVGADSVLVLTADFLASLVHNRSRTNGDSTQRPDKKLLQWAHFRSGSAVRLAKNPYRLFHRTPFATGLHPIIKDYYSRQVEQVAGRAICVFDHAQFSELIPVNRSHDIPTISCTQNFDALGDDFDSISSNLGAYRSAKIPSQRRLAVYATLTDFANELQSLAQCDERLCISKIEAGLMSGLGLSYYYYPYLPVGGLRQRQDRIRERRLSSPRESGLYLLIGSASYAPIRKSCEWFIQNAREHSLPPNVRVVVLGAGTEKLLPEGKSVRGIEVKGWTEQEELDDLLVKAQAVLVPQQFGFGAPTRLPELSCAGIPVIGCYHPTYAIDPPPGFHATEATWDAWYKRMEELRRETVDVTVEQYDAWESAQPKPLQLVVRNLLS